MEVVDFGKLKEDSMTVKGRKMVFSSEKWIARVTRNGDMHLVSDKILELVNDMDGRPVRDATRFEAEGGSPFAKCITEFGEVIEVNEDDCVPV